MASQRHEGWQAIRAHYDDGGFSGGSMDRPALRQLLEDIAAGKVDTVVVYKVDRLTRSLTDFAKIIEIFDTKNVSFVSVTQQFNTTTSMGRLTLNVLLSFAQFEREVTGERIRDKIAASKKKGMWMGGRVPLGYDLKDRKLTINEEEAGLVREIFKQYTRLGCVRKLKQYLDRQQIRTKVRFDAQGKKTGGKCFSRGALYQVLKNRLYIGQIHHRGMSYDGQHQAIIDQPTWEQVAGTLEANRHSRRTRIRAGSSSLLTGLLFDDQGYRYTPTHANKKGRRYRYYTSQAAIRGQGSRSPLKRLPAAEFDRIVVTRLRALFSSADELIKVAEVASVPTPKLKAFLDAGASVSNSWDRMARSDTAEYIHRAVQRVIVPSTEVRIEIAAQPLAGLLLESEGPEQTEVTARTNSNGWQVLPLTCALELKHRSNQLRLVVNGAQPPAEHRTSLIKAIARARDWYDRFVRGEVHSFEQLAFETGLSVRYVSRIFRCASLSPAHIETVLRGAQPADLTVERLSRIPLRWDQQRLSD
ncbi:MAG: recombinase family protein [Candidatus Korobacteraceae bacterium]